MAGGFLDKKSFKSRIPYQGITSFWRADYSQDLATADFAVYGVPCDASIVNRPGTRYGPRSIREQSCYVAIPGVNWPFDYDFMQKHRLIDWEIGRAHV